MKLYELTQNYRNLQELLDNQEISVEIINAALDEVTEEIEDKAENIAKIIKGIEADVIALKEEETRLYSKRKGLECRVKYLKEYLEGSMKVVNKSKIKGRLFSFSIQKNPPSLEIINEHLIPEKFFYVPSPTIDKKEVLSRLKAGEEVPGVAIKQTESLRIR